MENKTNNAMIFPDMFIQELIFKNCLNRRVVDLNEGFDEESIYKIIYMLEKLVGIDETQGIPMDKRQPITIRINSYGGYCYELWSLINIIEDLKSRGYIINTVCMGKAMSCGFVLFCSGVNRKMHKYSTLMYHNVGSGAYGRLPFLEDEIAETRRLNDLMNSYIVEKTGMDIQKLESVRRIDWIIPAEESLKYNIATEII